MKIQVTRHTFDDECTIGTMTVDGEFQCYTLEPTVRPVGAEKVPGHTAIPYGSYQVTVTFSDHFKRPMPLLMNVPNFEGVRIHPGNWPKDTEGCCLVGETEGKDQILQSVAAFDPLFRKIQYALAHQEVVTIEYVEKL